LIAFLLMFQSKVGANFANLAIPGAGPFTAENRVGRVAGLYVTRRVTPRFDIQPELLISRKGASFGEGGRAEIEIKYLEIPVLFRYGPQVPKRASDPSLRFFAGPSVALKLNAEASGEFPGVFDGQDIDDDVQPLDFGLVIGAEIEQHGILFDARYTWGLSNINARTDHDAVKVTNRAFAILVGCRLRL
jgi:Outer membrane protein beta-barrel domain